MNRSLVLLAVLLAGCDSLFGAPADRQACAASADCPAGQFCASAGGARVCWEDAVAPSVTGVAVSCPGGTCLRDGQLLVEAQVADDQELGPVTVALDLDGGARQVAMARVSGALHRATLQLAEWPLAGASAAVTATVTARDGARNQGAATAGAGQRPQVTRVRPGVALGGGAVVVPTAPALHPDGTVLVGGSTGKLYAVAPGASSATPLAVSLGAAVAQPPAIGQGAIWVVAGNRLYAVALDGSAVLNGAGYDAGGVIPGPAALTAAPPTAAAPEVAFVGSAGGRLAAVKADALVNGLVSFSGIVGPFTTSPALIDDTSLLAVTATAIPAAASLRRFSFDGAFREGYIRNVGQAVGASLALSDASSAWTGTAEFASSALRETTPSGAAGTTIQLSASVSGGPIVLAGGDVVVCAANALHRFTAAGAPAWGAPVTLDGVGLTPIALASAAGPPVLLVPTRSGTVHAVHSQSGAILWSASLAAGVELREGAAAAAHGAATTTAWFTSADGVLHGLVVDGGLDTAAPWPKAWHDARNTGNRTAAH